MLTERERPFDDLVEQLPVAVFEVSLEGNVTFVNEFGCEMFGYRRDEILGSPFFRFIAPED